MRADLHLHSTASDGLLTPTALMHACKDAGMKMVALTDHDTLTGVGEARKAARALEIDLITGVEMSLDDDLQIHLLGYGVLPVFGRLSEFLGRMQAARDQRAHAILARLEGLGIPIPYETVLAASTGVISRAHIASVMVDAGVVANMNTAFTRYLGPGKAAFVPKETVELAHAAALLKECGAVAVLAHPGRLRMNEMKAKEKILEWKEQGLMGLEVYHSSHSPSEIRFFRDVAEHAGLLMTGGSDFHGHAGSNIQIGQMMKAWRTMERDIESMCEVCAGYAGDVLRDAGQHFEIAKQTKSAATKEE